MLICVDVRSPEFLHIQIQVLSHIFSEPFFASEFPDTLIILIIIGGSQSLIKE